MVGSSNLSGGASGVMAEWLKARVCKTFGEIPRQFESGSHLYYLEVYNMQEQTKKLIANTLIIIIILVFAVGILLGEIETTPLQGGDIQHSIDTGQNK